MTPERSEILDSLRSLLRRLCALEETVNARAGEERIGKLEERMARAGFWDSGEKAQETIQELKRLRGEIDPIRRLRQHLQDTLELAELAAGENDAASFDEIAGETARFAGEVERLELMATLRGKHDRNGAFLSVHAGAGGTDACDWASMLARMYRRFCEREGFQVVLVDLLEGEEAGIKSITYEIKGEYAYGHLRSEIGVHRLVRKSPFDASNRRHTSFAAIDVVPEIPEVDKEIEINPTDLRIDTFRAGGAGGQHVNVTDSAVRITHLPTGIVVQCQNERSQHANRAMAMKWLKARLLLREEKRREKELEELYGAKGEIAWGSQIRSYVLEPYRLVKDRRTGWETADVEGVLDGDLRPLVEAYLCWKRKGAAPEDG